MSDLMAGLNWHTLVHEKGMVIRCLQFPLESCVPMCICDGLHIQSWCMSLICTSLTSSQLAAVRSC